LERSESNPSQTAAPRRVKSGSRFSAVWRWLAILKTDAKPECRRVENSPLVPSVADPSKLILLLTESPFSIWLLECENEHGADASRHDHEQLLLLLPVPYRAESGDLAAVGRQVTTCVVKELDLQRLANIHGWLWVAGRPVPPLPLHHQLDLGRDVVTERMDMHLVWTTGRMFLKPIPRFLLEPQFWTEYLSCGGECGCSSNKVDAQGCTQECGRGIRQRALGFLLSCAALISHETDFRIAKENHLLPPEISWPAWRISLSSWISELIYPHIDPRFHHDELRLSRLSKIYRLRQNLLRLPHFVQLDL
ncbi:hypothetical protein EDB80DRAFT_254970, partial [Ilyonectria destructans]